MRTVSDYLSVICLNDTIITDRKTHQEEIPMETVSEQVKPQTRKKKRISSAKRKAKRRNFFKKEENQRIIAAVKRIKYPTQNEAVKLAKNYFTGYFTSATLCHGAKREEINKRFDIELRAWTEAGRKPLAYFHTKSNLGYHVLKKSFNQKNPELAGVDKYVSEKDRWENLRKDVTGKLNRIWKEALKKEVYDYFTIDRIFALISKNKKYSFVWDRSEAKAAILERIPDKIADLYPLARTIDRHFILHVGPTNSGKTYDAVNACRDAERGVYLAPLRLLAMEVAERINSDGIPCDMVTGEEERRIPGSTHVASTIEMLSPERFYDVAVIDECQMITDIERGWAWTQAILGVAADIVHVCMAPEAENIVKELIVECGDSYEVVYHERWTPLIFEKEKFEFPNDVRKGDALVVFSRRSVLQAASALEDMGHKVSVIYGALPYEARRAETQKFAEGRSEVVVATDAIGMGMNLPVKRIVFLETQKFDGRTSRSLNANEIKQIAGRAGRRGYEEEGFVNAGYDRWMIAKGLMDTVPEIRYAKTSMPPFLSNMDQPLSQTMRDWQEIPDDGVYQKTNMHREINLALWLEANCDLTKAQELRSVSIPFAEDDRELLAIWKRAMLNVNDGKEVLSDIDRVTAQKGDGLDRLEAKYKILDLHYSLQRSFGAAEIYNDEMKRDILYCKGEVSSAIIERLKSSKHYYKRCKICGKKLPWHYPYRICENCHDAFADERHYHRRRA